MSRYLADITLRELLPDSIGHDATIQRAADAFDPVLRSLAISIPNVLLYARLLHTARVREVFPHIAPLMRLIEARGGLKELDTETLELLAWHFHVDFRDVATDNTMLARMIVESIPWHRIKGTPAAVTRALALYGFPAHVDESGTGENWAVYELELERVPHGDELKNILRVARETAPARCRLRRVYGGYDRRPIILDRGPALDVGYLDDDSGVWDEETGIKESFGDTTPVTIAREDQRYALCGITSTMGIHAFYVDRAILDQWHLDTPTVQNHGFVVSNLYTVTSAGISGNKWRWDHTEWDHRTWSGTEYPADVIQPIRDISTHYVVSKSQMCLDYDHLDDAFHHLDLQRLTVVDGKFVLDSTRLDQSNADMGVHDVTIHARRDVPAYVTTQDHTANDTSAVYRPGSAALVSGRSKEPLGGSMTMQREVSSGHLILRRESDAYGESWVGAWTHRTWDTFGVPSLLTVEYKE